MIDVVDLFCGAGGLTAGLRAAGLSVRAGYDIERQCKYAYEKNNNATFVDKDVTQVSADELMSWYCAGNYRLLAGCAPCQPFSSYNQGKDTRSDRKWPLLYAFSRLIKETEPHLVTMENVPDVTKHEVYRDFVEDLVKLGYSVWANPVHCIDYGLPQQRRRHVLLASKLGPIDLIAPTHAGMPVTVEETISKLSSLAAGECDPQDPLHRAASLTNINLKRIMHSKPGGTWKDWPEYLVADCHRKVSGKTYPSVYGRMRPDAPSPTMTTLCYGFGNGRFGHYDEAQARAISLREAAMLQSFPRDYEFMPPDQITFKAVGRMIGNAVPVRLGEVIGESLNRHVAKYEALQAAAGIARNPA
ncbi:DNA cytosine methyltransferase [Pseudomonas protegens]|uniref:DNA cytosine methyltransferase n=1 Tax=Pseudomonas protegens TaxID=380021 RepID=UPI001472BD8B|nr:DNA cytosine methyltransferase [Pseudomonas protegens]NMZ29606.1 DNA cytosine methyltransferase [Pseudomonas protegens]NMZ86654.1 DNA cytosine methyltransferase [Pseudomonas protegens]